MTDDQQRARELLALGLDEYGHHAEAANVRKGIDLDVYRIELWSITAALRAAPEGFVMVPAEATDGMVESGCMALAGSIGGYEAGCVRKCWDAMLAARPQGVK